MKKNTNSRSNKVYSNRDPKKSFQLFECRQSKRRDAFNRAKAQAKAMVTTHVGVPREERRRVCFQIAKETLAIDVSKDKLQNLKPGETHIQPA